MEIQVLHHVTNTQDGINLQVKDKNTHPSHVIYKGKCNWGQTYIGETARNLVVRVNEHSDVSKHSEPAKHIKKHPNHKFTWKVLTTVHSWLRGRIKQPFYIARFRRTKQTSAINGPHFVSHGSMPVYYYYWCYLN